MISDISPPVLTTLKQTVGRESCADSQTDPFLALLVYRATPLQATGVSPAQLMLGRQIRTTVPTLEANLQPGCPDLHKVRQNNERMKQSYRLAYNDKNNVRTLPDLQPGTSGAVKLDDERGWTKSASVIKQGDTPRSYLVQTDKGVLRRNRRHLRPLQSPTETFQEGGDGGIVNDGELSSPGSDADTLLLHLKIL
ncbi:hypothetical protein VZT92_022897 [Zoarces viviparus]|uniref:Neurotrophin-3 n=1 Tax=Zoarces viviparus TaxID=48416 RepID=A0AAW1E4J1_ZOAVI